MIRTVTITSAKGLIWYHKSNLAVGDYYAEGQECIGTWGGKGAGRLGLTNANDSAEVTPAQFAAMAMNRHPGEGGPLTERTVSNRRVAYDINFHAFKSASIRDALTKDDPTISRAFSESVDETMEQIQEDAKCRVRKGGASYDRTVGD
jgi:conjugative relaxase-like TrwC/TraI family protein